MCHILGGLGKPEGKARPCWRVEVGGEGSAGGALHLPLLSWGVLVVPDETAQVFLGWRRGRGQPMLAPWCGKEAWEADGSLEAMSQREACRGARFRSGGERLRFATREKRSWTSDERVSRAVAILMLELREVQSKGRSMCSPTERVEILAGEIGGKSCTGRPRLTAVSWKRETKRSRLPLGE